MKPLSIVVNFLLAGCLVCRAETTKPPKLSVKPDTVSTPGKATISITADDTCTNQLAGGQLLVLGQNVSVVPDTTQTQNCKIIATLDIGGGVPGNTISIEILKADDKTSIGSVDLKYKGPLPPGPIPPGIEPQVDVMWKVLSFEVCSDDFGKRVADRFYCIDVVIGNNTGYAIQIAGVGFLPDGAGAGSQSELPNSSYLATRAVLQMDQLLSARNLSYRGIEAAGLILGGFTPFFANSRPKAHFTSGVSLFDITAHAFDLVLPDRTIRQLSNLDDQTLRDGKLIPNNTQWRTTVFFEKTAIQERLLTIVNDSSHLAEPKNDCRQDRPCELVGVAALSAGASQGKGMRARVFEITLSGRNLYTMDHNKEIPATVTLPRELGPIEGLATLAGTDNRNLIFRVRVPGTWKSSYVPMSIANGAKSNSVRVPLNGAPINEVWKPANIERTGAFTNRSSKVTRYVSPEKVRAALSRLIIVGDAIEYKQRIRIDSDVTETNEKPIPLRLDSVRLVAGAALAVEGETADLVFSGRGLQNIERLIASDGVPVPKVTATTDSSIFATVTIPANFDKTKIVFTAANAIGNASIDFNDVKPRKPELADASPADITVGSMPETISIAGRYLSGTAITVAPAGAVDASKTSFAFDGSSVTLTLVKDKVTVPTLKITAQRGSSAALSATKSVVVKPKPAN